MEKIITGNYCFFFGFADDNNFRNALKTFIINVVDGAKISQYLPPLAENFFRKWQPPLKKK